MEVTDKVKKAAATAAGGFALANPLTALFLVGVGVAVWFSLKDRAARGR